MTIDHVMDTYLDLGFITKEQYANFSKNKRELLVDETEDKVICKKFHEYLGFLPDESNAADDMVGVIYEMVRQLNTMGSSA